MQLISSLVIGIIFTFAALSSSYADDVERGELTLRNQLFADIFYIKEGVDDLQISVEVFNKRYSKQMELLKNLQNELLNVSNSEEGENSLCERISGLFNTTFRKYNAFESRVVAKLEEIHDDQTTRLNEILVKQKLNRNCASRDESLTTVNLLSDTLTEVSEKINNFEKQFVKLETLETKLNLQQTKFEQFLEDHMKILKEINEKLSTSQTKLENLGQELTSLKDLNNNVNRIITSPRPKLPMEVILGLSSANVTSLTAT